MDSTMKNEKNKVDKKKINAPPPAPMRGPSRKALLKILHRPDAEAYLPITLAKYRPDAVVDREGTLWVIRALIEDREAVRRAHERAVANNENFTDEHTWQFLHPGPVLIEAASKDEFIQKIESMAWDYGEDESRS